MLLSLRNLELWTRIGVPEEERRSEQRVLVTIDMEIAEEKAGETDRIEDTVDYAEVAAAVKVVAKTERKTLEKLAEDIAKAVLEFAGVRQATIEVKKFPIPGVGETTVRIISP